MSQPNYMNNVMSRFGHHLSPNQRTYISDSMVSNLQSSQPGPGYLPINKLNIGTSTVSLANNNNSNPGIGGGGVTLVHEAAIVDPLKQ